MAVRTRDSVLAPHWPTTPVDPALAWVDYSVVADEFLVYLGGKPVPSVSDPLNAPGFRGAAIMLGSGDDDEATDEIVGVQVIPMLLGAVPEQPNWAILVWAAMAGDFGTELIKERLPAFLDEIRNAVEQYWTPPPSMEEQRAEIARAKAQREAAEAEGHASAASGDLLVHGTADVGRRGAACCARGPQGHNAVQPADGRSKQRPYDADDAPPGGLILH